MDKENKGLKLTEQAKEARRAYRKAWNAAHPEKLREYETRYWERKAAKMAELAAANGEPTDEINATNVRRKTKAAIKANAKAKAKAKETADKNKPK